VAACLVATFSSASTVVSIMEASESKPPDTVGTSKPRVADMGIDGARGARLGLLFSADVALKHRVEVEADVATRWRAVQKSVESIIVGSRERGRNKRPRQRNTNVFEKNEA